MGQISFIVTNLTRSLVLRDCRRRAPSIAQKLFVVAWAIRLPKPLRRAFSNPRSQSTCTLQLKKTAAFLELQLDAQRRVKRMSDLSGLVLSRCALRDYRFDCAALGHVFAAQHRLCLVVRRLPASCCPCLMRARCTPQAVLAACCSAWLRRSFRHNPRLRI